MDKIAAIRKDYILSILDEKDADKDAIKQFGKWWQHALDSQIEEVNAMTLATATPTGIPSARIVLLKGFDEKGFVFFTNYNSQKGKELEANPNAYLVFFWKELERQVRIRGTIQKTSSDDSNAYFLSRPTGSQVGAWASHQSSVIANRQVIEEKMIRLTEEFKSHPITKPPYWGGYCLKPQLIEFWQGRKSRLHDRLQYTLQQDSRWKIERLAP